MLTLLALGQTRAAAVYRPVEPAVDTADPVTLTGHDLTIEQIVSVARSGAPVAITPEAKHHQEDAHGLLLEAAAEGMAIPGLNRDGAKADAVIFDGDPGSPDVTAMLRWKALAAFQNGAAPSGSPEISDEEVVRAMMVVRANTLTYAPVSAPVTQMLLDFLNNRIAPVASASRTGSLAGVAAAMVGRGEVYYRGVRMPAAQALSQAGLTPVAPTDADASAFVETDAYDIGRAALLVADGRRALDWADLAFAMDLNAMNAGIAPLSLPAQANRPYRWVYWDAARVLDMIAGGYLLTEDISAVGAFPDTLALSPTRQGAAWRAWGALRDVVLVALNSSDQTPVVRVALSPRESPELATPQMARYFVKGGKLSGGKRGYIVPALNRDPCLLANEVGAFTVALGMLDLALAQRTGAAPPPAPDPDADLVPLGRARQALDGTFGLLALDLGNAAKLLDQRVAEDAARTFGVAPTAAWTAFRVAVPATMPPDTALSVAQQFLRISPAVTFYPKGEPPPGNDDPIPLAQERLGR